MNQLGFISLLQMCLSASEACGYLFLSDIDCLLRVWSTKRFYVHTDFHDYEKLAKAVLKADPSSSETGELQSDFDSICSNVGSFVAGVDSYKKIYSVA